MLSAPDWISWVGIFTFPIWWWVACRGYQRAKAWRKYCRSIKSGTTDLSVMQRGDPAELIQAPPPTSLYDFCIDWFTQHFVLNLYERVAERWHHFRSGFAKREATQETGQLEHEKNKSSLYANRAEADLRAAQADRQREKLWEPEPQRTAPKTKKEQADERRRRYEKEDTEYADDGYPADSYQRRMLKNEYENDLRQIFGQ